MNQPNQPSGDLGTAPDYVRLAEPPQLYIHYPTCGTCSVDLDHDGDSFTCPSCGTSWRSEADDGDLGELYPSWAGEEPAGPDVTANEAWQVAHLKGADREQYLNRLRREAARRG